MPSYPRYAHDPIPMARVGGRSAGDFKTVGQYFFRRGERGLALWLAVPNFAYRPETGFAATYWPIDYESRRGYQWTWNEDEDKPTLTPSLGVDGIWHGWVRDGMLVEA